MLTLEEGLTRLWLTGGPGNEWSEWARHHLRTEEEEENELYSTIERVLIAYDEGKLDSDIGLKQIAEAANLDWWLS
jgi:hypothetical protein